MTNAHRTVWSLKYNVVINFNMYAVFVLFHSYSRWSVARLNVARLIVAAINCRRDYLSRDELSKINCRAIKCRAMKCHGTCRFCSPERHFPYPTSSLPKIISCSDQLLVAKSECVGLIACTISFEDIQPMWSQITNVTDGQTDDGRHAIARPRFALKCIAR